MLISILLTLRAQHDATLPDRLGRALQAATLAHLAHDHASMIKTLHDTQDRKPLTCSGLLGVRANAAGVAVRAGGEYKVRITGLRQEISNALQESLLGAPPSQWMLHEQPFTIESAICDAQREPWSGSTSYEALAAHQLIQSDRLARQVTFEFATPTAFKITPKREGEMEEEAGKTPTLTMPVPLPGLVFGSLVDRWNDFSPITLSREMRRYGEEMMAISRYRLESRAVEQKGGGLRIGAIGQATYSALGGDRYWLGVMNMLAEFALYSGVGVQTMTGMGQVRRVG